MQNEKPPETTPHSGRATSPQNWAAKKSCYGQTLIDECSIIDHPSRLKGLQLASDATPPQTASRPPKSHPTPDQKAKEKSKRDRNCTPIPPGNPRGSTPDHPIYPTHPPHPSTNRQPHRQASRNTPKVINENSPSALNHLDDFRYTSTLAEMFMAKQVRLTITTTLHI